MNDRFKLLLWKVTWDVFPTKVKLAERIGGCDLEDAVLICGLCGDYLGSLLHLLLVCPCSRAVWSESSWHLNCAAFGGGSDAEWVKVILHRHQAIGLPLEDQLFFQLYAVNAIDMVWAARNELEHGGRKWAVQDLVRRVRHLSGEHLGVWKKKLHPVQMVSWAPPLFNIIKINFDAAIRDSFAVVAAVTWDCEGQIKGAAIKCLDAVDPVEGEVEAAKLGVQLACDKGYSKVTPN